MAHYQVSIEGSLDPSFRTPAATGADWDQAVKDARERSLDQGRNYTVRRVESGRGLIVATLVGAQIVRPCLVPPEVDMRTGELADRELEA